MIDPTIDRGSLVSELSLKDIYPSAVNNNSVTLAHCIQMGDVWRLHDAYANNSIDTGLNYADAWIRVTSSNWLVWCVDPCYNPPTIFIVIVGRTSTAGC